MTDDEIKAELCRRLIEGESLRTICRSEGMPATSTICRWLAADQAFQAEYKFAREMQADTLADEILNISDDGTNDYMADKDGEGGVRYNGDAVQRSKLRVDSRKWLAAKMLPKKYGDAAMIKHADSDGNRLATMDDNTRVTRLAAIFAEVSMRAEKALTHDR